MEHPFFKATIAAKSNDPELEVGESVHISITRMQAYFKIKKGAKKGLTKCVMNTPDEVFYVEESPKDIKELIKQKALGLDQDDDE